ncbi:MAG TPA: nitroreductase family protein [Candidatus Limnocylindria bacterium]|nr:nitroreductase family protein [Candidatus Limnocylindria bacterium]
MTDPASPREMVRPLLRARQVREFTDVPLTDAQLAAIADVARWTGSSRNTQPWRFVVIRDRETIGRLEAAGLPQTRALKTATAVIAIVLPVDPERVVSHAYDDGRAAERMLIAADMLGAAAGIAWVRPDVLPAVREILDLPDDRMIRTLMAIGHPTEEARKPKSPPGQARLPREQSIFTERLPPD